MSAAPDLVIARAPNGGTANAGMLAEKGGRLTRDEDGQGPEHRHNHDHHSHDHDSHAAHGHLPHAHPPSPPGFSLLRLSAQSRLLAALCLIACIWAGVFWAIA